MLFFSRNANALRSHAVARGMLEAALTHGVPVEKLSFKGSVDAILAWGVEKIWASNGPETGYNSYRGPFVFGPKQGGVWMEK